MPPRLGIALGDVTGIGPEIALKALAALHGSSQHFLLLGDEAHIERANRQLPQPLAITRYSGTDSTDPLCWIDSRGGQEATDLSDPIPPGSPGAARAAMGWLRDGTARCLRGELSGLVTAPVNKEAIIDAGYPWFVGQTEFLTELAGSPPTAMMLLGHDDRGRWLRVSLATIHVPLKSVADRLTTPGLLSVIQLTDQACRKLALPRSKIAVCGLNPHAGEGGKIGMEEIQTISPTLRLAREQGIDAHGPLPADTCFHQVYRGDYDAVVAMYHDQGLAPLKMVAFDSGVNWTLGLPFVRTSPDHGTAYDLAGRNQANPSSMIAAIDLAMRLQTRSSA